MTTRAFHFLFALALTACGDKDDDSGDGTSSELLWYTSCGDPSCGGYTAAAHTNAPCSSEVVGDACTPEGAGCDLEDDCNTELVCATEDPKLQEGGCPISLRSAKTGIRYLDASDTQALHGAVLGMRLADWRYRSEVAGSQGPESPTHLGFIIDDLPAGSPAVRATGDRVDLYGYTSMMVAALQVQDAQIAQLEARLAALEAQTCEE